MRSNLFCYIISKTGLSCSLLHQSNTGNEVRLLAIYHTDTHSRLSADNAHSRSTPSQPREGSLTLHPFPFTNVKCKLVPIRKVLFTLGKLSALLIVYQVRWWFPGTCASAHWCRVDTWWWCILHRHWLFAWW